jgi:hypothetical protein
MDHCNKALERRTRNKTGTMQRNQQYHGFEKHHEEVNGKIEPNRNSEKWDGGQGKLTPFEGNWSHTRIPNFT